MGPGDGDPGAPVVLLGRVDLGATARTYERVLAAEYDTSKVRVVGSKGRGHLGDGALGLHGQDHVASTAAPHAKAAPTMGGDPSIATFQRWWSRRS